MEPLHIEYMRVSSDNVSKSELFDLHQNQLSNGLNNNENIYQIVEVFGGIDDILSHYLSSQNSTILSQHQLTQIHKIINNTQQKNDNIQIIHTFKSINTFIHRIFNTQRAEKIINAVYNKWLICIIIISIFSYITWDLFTFGTWDAAIFVIWSFIVCFVTLIWFIALFLSINIKAFILSAKTFLFWFKIYAIIEGCILYWILRYGVDYFGEASYTFGQIIVDIIEDLWFIMVVINFCAIDGIQIARKYKIIMGLSLSTLTTGYAIYITLNAPQNDISVIDIVGRSWSVYSSWTSSARVLSLFLWKQTISLLLRKDTCINIMSFPYIKWV